MSTHNIGFYEDLTKNIFLFSSNTQLISSSAISLLVSCKLFFSDHYYVHSFYHFYAKFENMQFWGSIISFFISVGRHSVRL